MNIPQNWVTKFSCLFSLFFITNSYSQKRYHPEYDETVNQILKTLHYEAKNNIDSLNRILKRSDHVCMRTLAIHYDASIYYLLKNDLDKAEKKSLECINKAKKYQSAMDNNCYSSITRISATRLFYIYRRKGEFDKALKVVLDYKKNIEHSEFLSFVAINQYDLQNYDKAIEKFNLCLQKSQKKHSDYLVRTANIHNYIGDCFVQKYKKTQKEIWLDSANQHYLKSYSNGNKFNKNNSYNSALYYSRLAKTEFYKKNYAKAIIYYNSYFNHPVVRENAFTYQSYCIGLAEANLKLKKTNQAFEYLKKMDSAYNAKSGTEQFHIAVLSAYMDAYQQKGDDGKALHFAKMYLNEIKKSELSKVRALEEMNLLNVRESNAKAQQIIDSKNNWLLSLFIVFMVLTVIIFTVIRVYNFKLKNKLAENKSGIKSFEKPIDRVNSYVHEESNQKLLVKSKYLTDINGFNEIQKKLLKLEHKNEFLNPEFKLSYLAKKLGTNTTYLSAFFNDFLQKGFSQYLQEKRIEYLLNLLNQENVYRKYTVQAISEHIGYKSASAFTKIFKKHTGISFSLYLEKLKCN